MKTAIKFVLLSIVLSVAGCTSTSVPQSSPSAQKVNKDTVAKKSSNIEHKTADQSTNSLWDFLLKTAPFGLLIIGIGGFIYYYYRQKGKVHALRRAISHKNTRISDLKQTNQALKTKYKDLKRKKNSLSDKINKIKRKNDELKRTKNSEDKPRNKSDLELTNTGEIGSNHTLYFTVPSENGVFQHEKGIETPESKRYYRIDYTDDAAFGTIKYREGVLDASAIDQRDSILRPVCHIKNFTQKNPSSVNMISPGKVRREQDKWVIEEMIKVELK